MTAWVGGATRWVQRRVSDTRPIRGYYRLHRLLSRLLPPYAGPIRLNNGLVIEVDTARSGVDRWLFFAGSHEPALSRFLSRYAAPGAVCIDECAHYGIHTLMLARSVGVSGRVIAFEANPQTAALLRRNLALNGLAAEVVGKGVSDSSGTSRLYVATPGMSTLVPSAQVAYTGELEVETVTLDEFWPTGGLTHLEVVKIDVEGHDLKVIQGAKRLLAGYRPFLCFEWISNSDRVKAADLTETLAFLSSLDYRLYLLDPSERLAEVSAASIAGFAGPNGNYTVVCEPGARAAASHPSSKSL